MTGERQALMRYRRSTYRYAAVINTAEAWLHGDVWPRDRVRLLVHGRWAPDVDMFETGTTVEIVVDLAGVGEDDFEIQLFDDALIVEGRRRLFGAEAATVYHAAGIRQGPFRVEVVLPAAVDPDRVEARYDHGLIRITLGKHAEGR
jgi:HSP20 family molecular chaperone IbpA